METINIAFEGGESRMIPGQSVDYMLAEVDGVELYAEAPIVIIDEDEGTVDESANYEGLKADIIEQAKDNGIDPACLRFLWD